MKSELLRSVLFFVVCTVLCGVIYTGVITGVAQLAFADKANGSIMEVDGVKYGSELVGQQFTKNEYMWGRITNVSVVDGLAYGGPSNISPASEDFEVLLKERIQKIKAAHPEKEGTKIPVDLVTGSGSGLDPHISTAAATYQIERLAINNNLSNEEVRAIIEKCSNGRFLGIFGEETVNVLKVNLMLKGILG